jgi:hypothetical protein
MVGVVEEEARMEQDAPEENKACEEAPEQQDGSSSEDDGYEKGAA